MWSIIRADWRRFAYLLLGGWAMFAVVFVFAYEGLTQDCCPAAAKPGLYILKILLFLLAYAQSPAVLWAQLGGNHIYFRQKLLATLPMSRTRLNLVHYATGGVLLAGGLPPMLATYLFWRHVGIPFEPWMAVSTLLAVAFFLVLSMRNLFPRVLIPLFFALIIIPGTENFLAFPLELMTERAVAPGLAIITFLFAAWAIRRPTPHWAPEMGGRARRALR
jgi:hypothetical protein